MLTMIYPSQLNDIELRMMKQVASMFPTQLQLNPIQL